MFAKLMYGGPMNTDTKHWLTRGQAAARHGIGIRTVDRMLSTGRLTRHRRPGTRHVLIDAAELDAALEPAPQRSAS
jgi:excisionase family DNA binding protein